MESDSSPTAVKQVDFNVCYHKFQRLQPSVTSQDLARQVAYLKEENKILRARLPERLVATPHEKRRLLKFGR